MKTMAFRLVVVVALFALYMLHPVAGFAGLTAAFAYVCAKRARAGREPGTAAATDRRFGSPA